MKKLSLLFSSILLLVISGCTENSTEKKVNTELTKVGDFKCSEFKSGSTETFEMELTEEDITNLNEYTLFLYSTKKSEDNLKPYYNKIYYKISLEGDLEKLIKPVSPTNPSSSGTDSLSGGTENIQTADPQVNPATQATASPNHFYESTPNSERITSNYKFQTVESKVSFRLPKETNNFDFQTISAIYKIVNEPSKVILAVDEDDVLADDEKRKEYENSTKGKKSEETTKGYIFDKNLYDTLDEQINQIILPRLKNLTGGLFPEEQGVQGTSGKDGYLTILLSSKLNENVNICSFDYRDTFEKNEFNLFSNEQYIIYCKIKTTTPESFQLDFDAIYSSLIREITKLIIFSKKYLKNVNGAPKIEEISLIEGWAAIMEDMTGYGTEIKNYVNQYLDNINSTSILPFSVSTEKGAKIGGSYLFLKYILERKNKDGKSVTSVSYSETNKGDITGDRPTLITNLLSSNETGIENIESFSTKTIEELFKGWVLTLIYDNLSDKGKVIKAQYQYDDEVKDSITLRNRGIRIRIPEPTTTDKPAQNSETTEANKITYTKTNGLEKFITLKEIAGKNKNYIYPFTLNLIKVSSENGKGTIKFSSDNNSKFNICIVKN